jgi:hypothetical protein
MKDELIKDLRSLLEGNLCIEAFREKIKGYPNDVSNLISGNISHFLDDADIRHQDSNYKKMQETELKKLITLIERNASKEEIQRISFLNSSRD